MIIYTFGNFLKRWGVIFSYSDLSLIEMVLKFENDYRINILQSREN